MSQYAVSSPHLRENIQRRIIPFRLHHIISEQTENIRILYRYEFDIGVSNPRDARAEGGRQEPTLFHAYHQIISSGKAARDAR